MTTSDPILRQYELIADIASHMLELAQANDWEAVVVLSHQYQEAVDNLRALQPLTSADRLARRELLTRILDHDARIRSLASPELERLGTLLGATKRRQSVLETYCGPAFTKS